MDIQGVQGDDEASNPEGGDREAYSRGISLLPVVWNRRLYLFWLILTKKSKKIDSPKTVTPSEGAISIEEPTPYWEISLAWSKNDQGKWTPKELSGETITYLDYDRPKEFGLHSKVQNGTLELDVLRGVDSAILEGKFILDDYNGDVS